MAMKAYACPRCLTLSSECEDGDGGAHTCTATPLVRDLETRIAELEAELIETKRRFSNDLRAWGDRIALALPPES